MLQLKGYEGVHDPIEAQDRVNGNGSVVPPDLLISKLLAEKGVLGVRISKTPVIVDIPEAGVDAVNCGKSDEGCPRGGLLVHAVDAQCGVEHDGGHVLSEIKQVRELVPSICVTAKALQSTPYSRQSCQEADDTQVRRIAGPRLVPPARVQAKECCQVLSLISEELEN
jgi:hypothetical protein